MTISAPPRDPRAVFEALEAWCRAEDYTGWDPFDGLESRLLAATPLCRVPFVRLAWLQLFKRSPVNLRRLALVPKTTNAATLALVSRGYGLIGEKEIEARLVDRLLHLRSTVWPGPGCGWGYPFDWQARAFAVPRDVPNVISTAYAVRALAETTGRITDGGVGGHTATILEAAHFVEAALVRSSGDGRRYLGYVPNSGAMVHNANLWGAYILAEGSSRGGPSHWRDLALAAIRYSLSAQQADGSWCYGEQAHHRFIDSFHTGYNLEALHLCASLLGTADWNEAIERGLTYYERSFFTPDGQPKYYHNRLWPADCTCTAQAVITLLNIAPTDRRHRLAGQVLTWTIDHMWQPERSAFAYQRHHRWVNRIAYMRWTQAWMFLALTQWLTAVQR